MDSASSFSTFVKNFWDLLSTRFGYIYYLEYNVNLLEKETGALNADREDRKARMDREEEGGGVQPTKEMVNWSGRVDEFSGRVDRVLQEVRGRDRITCLGFCPPQNCWPSYRLGEKVVQMLDEVRKLKQEKFDTTMPRPPPPVLVMPLDKTVGLDNSFDIVWNWLVGEQQKGMIGLHGMGGVGKTTLMTMINNELPRANPKFEIVIWVVVSKSVNEDSIRDTIRNRLGIKGEVWGGWSPEERLHRLREVLTRKKCVLLIDDVRVKLHLTNIGVPRPGPENGSKVVFTTRSEKVCQEMEADVAHPVQCLTPKEALQLFENNAGKSIVHSDPEILNIAEHIVQECKGLPLALKIAGQAMVAKDNLGAWRHALTMLRNKPHKLPGMVEEVYHVLEYSYDSLVDDTRKGCFLYCCLFPEDYPIRPNDLIELWIGEGLLEPDDLYNMRNEGAFVLGDLKEACLLETGRDVNEKQVVKMHDVIRDMATWIARNYGQRENKLLVIEKEEDMVAKMISKWGEAEKVSIWGRQVSNIDQAPPICPQLKTLIVRETYVSVVPRGFFDSMTACLMVLDLSDNYEIQLFPKGICNLTNLWYLNLSRTSIKGVLPREIKNLTCLRWLLLDDIVNSIQIPTEAITSLPLNVLGMWETGLDKEEETVDKLGGMQDLTDLSITVCNSSSVRTIFQSLQKCIRRVVIATCINLIRIPIRRSLGRSRDFLHLEELYLDNCPKLVKMEIQAPDCSCFPNLVNVRVYGCGFSDLSWLVHAPKLRRLTVVDCNSMEKIIRDEFYTSGLFSHIESLMIRRLPSLKSICDHILFFLRGVHFNIQECPDLRNLPLDSNSVRGSFSIEGDKQWWAKFQWDPAARVTFQQWHGRDPPVEKEITFEEAERKMKDEPFAWAQIEFLPSRAE